MSFFLMLIYNFLKGIDKTGQMLFLKSSFLGLIFELQFLIFNAGSIIFSTKLFVKCKNDTSILNIYPVLSRINPNVDYLTFKR